MKSRVVCVCYRCAVAPDARIDFVCSGYLYRKFVYGLTVVKALTENTVRQVRNLAACKLCGGLGGGNIRHILSCAALCFVADAKLNCTCAVLGTAAQIVAVLHVVVITSNHAADIFAAADRTGIVTVLHGAADHVTSDHAADIFAAADRTGIVATQHGAAVIRSNHAAHIAHTAYGNVAVAVEYIGVACEISHDAACGSVPTAYRGVYRSAYVQILDKIIAQAQVAGIILDIPEKSDVFELLIGRCRAADGKALDGIACAVKDAAEYVMRTVDTDGDPRFSRKIDILRELDEFARKSTCRCR